MRSGGPAPDRGEPSVCFKHPGFASDLIVVTTSMAMMRVFSGIVSLQQAVDDRSVDIQGPPSLVRGFGRWFLWSPFSDAVKVKVADG